MKKFQPDPPDPLLTPDLAKLLMPLSISNLPLPPENSQATAHGLTSTKGASHGNQKIDR